MSLLRLIDNCIAIDLSEQVYDEQRLYWMAIAMRKQMNSGVQRTAFNSLW